VGSGYWFSGLYHHAALLKGWVVDLTTIEVIITLAKTAAERLDVVAESKLDTKSLAETREAQHALANLRQHLSILHEQLRRLQADSDGPQPLRNDHSLTT
jgi:hypothetical protein